MGGRGTGGGGDGGVFSLLDKNCFEKSGRPCTLYPVHAYTKQIRSAQLLFTSDGNAQTVTLRKQRRKKKEKKR